jgi:hypothetical protein
MENVLEGPARLSCAGEIAGELDIARGEGPVGRECILEARPDLQRPQAAHVLIEAQLGVEMERPVAVDPILQRDCRRFPDLAIL